MKKIIALVVALSCLCVSTGLADIGAGIKKKDEIKYLGISWLSDINSVVQNASEYLEIDEGDFTFYTGSTISAMSKWGNSDTPMEDSGFCAVYSCDAGNVNIAGHKVKEIDLYGLYGISDDEISRDINDSRFCKAEYVFGIEDNDNVDLVYADLCDKLKQLYGESSTPLIQMGGETNVWYGDNDTVVMLDYVRPGFVGTGLYIYYARTDIEEMQTEIYNIQNGIDSGNTGL